MEDSYSMRSASLLRRLKWASKTIRTSH